MRPSNVCMCTFSGAQHGGVPTTNLLGPIGAIAALGPGWVAPPGTTLYSSLEPCGSRASRPRTCTDLILAAGIGRVVFAWREPSSFVDGRGTELLRTAGVEVVELPELAGQVREINRHLLAR